MAEHDRRNGGSRGGYQNRKRRYREDDDYDHRPQRRRYEEPVYVRLRKELLGLAESPLKRTEDEVSSIAKTVVDSYEDEELRNTFLGLALQLVVEQPLKIPFLAAIVLAANPQNSLIAHEVIARCGTVMQEHLDVGAWREVKLILRFLGCLQGLLEADGVFSILEELFSRAVDLQTASSEDGLGLELVKIILLTIPYVMASSATGCEEQALALLDKTDIIASTPHALEALVDPYPGNGEQESREPQSVISLLQKQLQTEAAHEWPLLCIPRAWKVSSEENGRTDAESLATNKHPLPRVAVPSPVSPGVRPRLPEIYFSVYAEQEIETVPSVADVASSLLRDSIVDTINILDYNRNATAKFLIDVDCYFSPNTFVKRATPFDKLRDLAGGTGDQHQQQQQQRSTWKPEDVAVDAVFSQLFQLPTPEHKLVYYHAVLTEACKIAPAAIAPSLGRAIRYLYKNVDSMDLELEYRFMDWFSHHLSNFGFTWKWTEWIDDVGLPIVHPKKAFMLGALEKEIRLSFAQRIRGTLPEPYQPLIPQAKEKDTPDFKYDSDQTPYSAQGIEVLRLLRAKAPETDTQTQLTSIEETAKSLGVTDPLVPSTDAYVTAICFIGSKSLSHLLSCVERCKERLLAIGPQSESARRQIISSVMEYWKDQPGIGVNIIDKLLNYTILTPMSVIEWALVEHPDRGWTFAHAHVYEMVAGTVFKVTNRVRQIVLTRNQPGLPGPQVALLDETLARERAEQAKLFATLEDALVGVADASLDGMLEGREMGEQEAALLQGWGYRWLRVFRRKMAVEEAWIAEMLSGMGEADGKRNGAVDGQALPEAQPDEVM